MEVVRKLIFLLLALSVGASQAMDNLCQFRFASYRKSKIDMGVPAKHLPRLEPSHIAPSKNMVIFIHGLFESPYFFQGITQDFAEHGYNTLSILLPGHWDRDLSRIDRITYEDWLREVDKAVEIAQCFDQKILFAGHSLGGALATIGVLKYPDRTVGLAVWAPAFELKALPTFGAFIGSITSLSGNAFIKQEPDHDEVPKYSGNAVKQMYDLIRYIGKTYGEGLGDLYGLQDNYNTLPLSYLSVYKKIAVPTFVVIPEKDPAVSPKESLEMYKQVAGPKKLIVYPEDSSIWHGNVTKSNIDTYKIAPNGFNKHFDDMTVSMENFFDEYLKNHETMHEAASASR